MRIAIPALLLAVTLTAPAWGRGRGANGSGVLRVTNTCDEAVEVTVEGIEPVTLEPQESEDFERSSLQSPLDLTVTAVLVSTPDVTATDSCEVQKNKLTTATITCSHTASGVSLAIECDRPQKETLAGKGRDSAVMLASGGGLGMLALLGALLGRAPRTRPEDEGADSPPATSA